MNNDAQPHDTSEAFVRISRAVLEGRGVDFGTKDGSKARVYASEIRSAIQETSSYADLRALTLSRCSIAGPLDLSNLTIPFPIAFEACIFEEPINLQGSTLRSLSFTRCRLEGGVNGNGCTLVGDLILDDSKVVGNTESVASTNRKAVIWLCEASISGRLVLQNSTEVDGQGSRSIQADRLSLGGNFRLLSGSRLLGELRLLSAHISGSIDVVSSTIEANEAIAIELAEARIGGSLFIVDSGRSGQHADGSTVTGILAASDAQIGAGVRIKRSSLTGESVIDNGPFDRLVRHSKKVAILGARIQIGDDIVIDRDTKIDGAIVLPNAVILGDVVLSGANIRNPNDRSLNLDRAQVRGSLIAEETRFNGTASLIGCEIGSSVTLDKATFDTPDGESVLLATRIAVGGDVRFRHLSTEGGAARFRGALIGGEVDGSEAQLANPDGDTLSFSNSNVGGTLLLERLKSAGRIEINRATIGGRLRFSGAVLECAAHPITNPGGTALEVISADVRGGMYLDWRRLGQSAAFFSTRTSILADSSATWPAKADMSGLFYERYGLVGDSTPSGSAWNVRARLDILSTQSPFDVGPYEHAASVYKLHGRHSDAEQILIEGRRQAAADELRGLRASGPSSRIQVASLRMRNWFYDKTVRYGYRPARALMIIALLVGCVWVSLIGPWSGRDSVMRAVGPSDAVYSPAQIVTGSAQTSASDSTASCGVGVRCFRASIYAIETVVPLVDLGQRDYWFVDSKSRVGRLYELCFSLATIAGWILSSVFVLSFSKLGRTG